MPSIAAEKTARRKIIVVEDDLEMIKLHLNFLSNRFTVIVKSSGVRAVDYFHKREPDVHLAIIDVVLPDLSGIEVLKEIKKTMPLLPTIILTAYGSEDVAVKAFRCGARDYVKKPFIYTELLKRINLCLPPDTVVPANSAAWANVDAEAPVRLLPVDTNPITNYHLRQALQFIHNNFSANISLCQTAGIARVSRCHFSRIFKEASGFTFQSYVNRLRIERARNLLDDDALTITDVGLASGYTDLTHFERIFKKMVGLTPSQYRCRKSA